jgi:hypothetical protein
MFMLANVAEVVAPWVQTALSLGFDTESEELDSGFVPLV